MFKPRSDNSRGFNELSSLIEDIYEALGLLEEFNLGCIKNKWPQIVGEGLSIHSEPYSLKDGELLIKVRSHLWAEEMRFYSDLILQRLKPYKVKTLKFRIGKVNSKVVYKKSNLKEKEFPSGEISGFEDSALSLISDERLRDSIKRAMEKSLGRNTRIKTP